MKRVLVVLVLAVAAVGLLAVPSSGATNVDFRSLEGSLVVVGTGSHSVTVQVVQTAGPDVQLVIQNWCKLGVDNGGQDNIKVRDGDTVTLNTGLHKVNGKLVQPDSCFADLMYQVTGNGWWRLDSLVTL